MLLQNTRWMNWLLVVLVSVPVLAGGCADEIVPPTADAGAGAEAAVGETVTLDASASSDAQDLALSYQWSFRDIPAGSEATFNDATLVRPSFTADTPGTYVAELIVSNGVLASEPAQVQITVSDCGSNAPVVSEITSSPAEPGVGTPIALSAIVADADNADGCGMAQALTYHWKLVSVPASSQVEIAHPEIESPALIPDAAGTYVVELVVSDATGRASAPAQATIEVSECGAAAPTLASLAADPAQPHTGQPARLSVEASDPDNADGCAAGQSLSYAWNIAELPAGSQAQLNSATAASPSFTPDVPGEYLLEVQVTDSTGLDSSVESLAVTVSDCGSNAPDAGAITATPAAASIGQPVQLSASPADADNATGCDMGQTVAMSWRLVALPPGSMATLNQTDARNPSFVPDKAGDYIAELVVTDSSGLSSAPAEVTIEVSNCGTVAPTINGVTATPSSTPIGQSVQLEADVTDADNQGPCNLTQTMTYQWTLVGLPAGSRASINGNAAQMPSLTPDVPGTYTVELVVTDSNGMRSQPAYVNVTANDCGGAEPVALIEEVFPNASPGAAASVTAPDVPVGALVQVSGQASYDTDNSGQCGASQELSYTWSMMALPAGSRVSLNHRHIINPWFEPDVAGVYVLHLQVTDDTGRTSATATFTVTATPLVGVQTQSGFTTTTVTAGSVLNQPMGVTGDGSGNLYVVQNGGDSVLRIGPGGATDTIAVGGMLRDATGIAYDPNSGELFVSASDNRIIRIDQNGGQSRCVTDWGVDFRGLTFYAGTQGDRIIAAARDQDELWFIDPQTCSVDTRNDFGGDLDQPWGVAATTVNGNDNVATADDSGDIWRNVNGTYQWDGGSNNRVTDQLFDPRGLSYTPCADPKLIVADRAAGTVTAFDNCGGGNCQSQTLVSGLDEPTGVFFDSNGDLIVTDPGKQAVFQISGNFCAL